MPPARPRVALAQHLGQTAADRRLIRAELVALLGDFFQGAAVPDHKVHQRSRLRVERGELAFSAETDVAILIQMYRSGFLTVFETYRRFDPDGFFAAYAGLEWGDTEATQVASALGFAAAH